MSPPERDATGLRYIAEALTRRPVDAVAPARPGGNNRVYRITCGWEVFALKFYPPQEADRRDRLGREYGALSFLSRHGISAVPRPLGADPENHCALYEWLEGTPVDKPDIDAVRRLAAFLVALQGLRMADGAEALEPASDACLAAGAALDQLDRRLARLAPATAEFPDLADFLDEEFRPALDRARPRCLDALARAGIDSAASLPAGRRALSPSDFGLHNALRRPDGRLAFVDFEYMGWDDPAKAVADAMLHPGRPLGEILARRFRQRVEPAFARLDPGFDPRFQALFPVFALIWCLIVLNEFLPERWERRLLAGQAADRDAVLTRQLAKARALLARLPIASEAAIDAA